MCWVPLGALVRGEDEVLGLELGLLQLLDVAIELADIGSDERIAFPFLDVCKPMPAAGWRLRGRPALLA